MYPINPKYPEIYGLKTFKSAEDTPDIPENIVLAMSVANNIKVLETLKNYKTSFVCVEVRAHKLFLHNN